MSPHRLKCLAGLLKRHSFLKLTGLKSSDSRIQKLRELKKGKNFTFKHSLISQTGDQHYVKTRVTTIDKSTKTLFLLCSSPASNSETGDDYWVSEQKYKNFIELLPEMICEAHLNGKIRLANKYAYEKLQFSVKDIENGMTLDKLFIPKDLRRDNPSPGIYGSSERWNYISRVSLFFYCL